MGTGVGVGEIGDVMCQRLRNIHQLLDAAPVLNFLSLQHVVFRCKLQSALPLGEKV